MTDVKAAWMAARARLDGVSASPSLDAQVLLAHVLGTDNRAYLFAHPEQILTPEQAAAYDALIARRVTGEPVAYLRGFADWYDRRFIVTPDVLIPRPETELLLEAALAKLDGNPHAVVADIGTGSGALAVTLAAHHSGTVIATDTSEAALTIARRNAEAQRVRVDFRHGDLLAPLIADGPRVDVLVSNPPYIAHNEMLTLDVSHHEPHAALDGGTDGLTLVRRLLADAPRVCNAGAWVFVEFGASQGTDVLALAKSHLRPVHAAIHQDYAGHDRYLVAQLP